MKFALTLTTLLAWALWLGGTIATFVFAKHFFAVFPRESAGESANAMFHAFTKYELALAGIAIMGSGLLLVTYPTKSYVFLLASFIMASCMVIFVGLGLMPRMDAMIGQGLQHDPMFIKLHVRSMIAMTLQSGLLVISGAILLVAAGMPIKLPKIGTNVGSGIGSSGRAFEPVMESSLGRSTTR